MRLILVWMLFLFCVLLPTPLGAIAQTDTQPVTQPAPTPTPFATQRDAPSAAELEYWGNFLVNSLQQFGSGVVLTVGVLLIIALVIIFILRPAMGGFSKTTNDAIDSRRELSRVTEKLDATLDKVTDVVTANTEAFRQISVSNAGVEGAINRNTQALESLGSRMTDNEKAVKDVASFTREGFLKLNERLDGVVEELRQIRRIAPAAAPLVDQALEKIDQLKHDTAPLNPDVVPPTDPAANS